MKACTVTDSEAGIVKAVIPEWKMTTCWNHTIHDVEFWLKKHAAHSVDISVDISVYKKPDARTTFM